MSLRIGEINYTNIMPMFFYLDRTVLNDKGFTFYQATPAQLNDQMAEGTIDIGGISSFEYARNPGDYIILPDLSVSSIGNVGSIFLFSKVPAEELNNRSIGLTSSSATSVHLLKIIMHQYFSIHPDYVTEHPSLHDMLSKHDACLLIGDDAIKASWSKQDSLYKYDLGGIWDEWTRYPMTYALFAVRKQAARKHPEALEYIYEAFQHSKEQNINESFQNLTKMVKSSLGGSEKFWAEYFQQLNFKLSQEHQYGLELFFNKLFDEGYIKEPKKLQLWKPVRQDFISKVDIK